MYGTDNHRHARCCYYAYLLLLLLKILLLETQRGQLAEAFYDKS